jgi:hypothetical protein
MFFVAVTTKHVGTSPGSGVPTSIGHESNFDTMWVYLLKRDSRAIGYPEITSGVSCQLVSHLWRGVQVLRRTSTIKHR